MQAKVFKLATACIVTIAAYCIIGNHLEIFMPEPEKTNQRISAMFLDTKITCFGRYAVEVPRKAELDWGDASFPSRIETFTGKHEALIAKIDDDLEELKTADMNFEVLKQGAGPTDDSLELRYFRGKYSKKRQAYVSNFYVSRDEIFYSFRGTPEKDESEINFSRRMVERITRLRLRTDEELTSEPGFCIDHGFIKSAAYDDQEMMSAGLHLPDFPDVTFSVSSNKDAYGDYSSAEFEGRVRGELSLLARIKAAQVQQGIHYPKRTVLREGKRAVQHWKGEESLIRRADGTHDFEWAFVGTPGDVANPSEFSVQMFTKVAQNTVGAAEKASLSDAEAIALWDRLLSGLKFRVKVPGAPEGSYYFLPGAATDGSTKP